MSDTIKVSFVCIHNAARSRIGEAASVARFSLAWSRALPGVFPIRISSPEATQSN